MWLWGKHVHTICPRSSDPFYIVSYYIKWVITSWTHSRGSPVLKIWKVLVFFLEGRIRIRVKPTRILTLLLLLPKIQKSSSNNGQLPLTLLSMGCFYPYIWWGEGEGFDSIHPLFICENLQGCLRTMSPLDHTLEYPWNCLVLAVNLKHE